VVFFYNKDNEVNLLLLSHLGFLNSDIHASQLGTPCVLVSIVE